MKNKAYLPLLIAGVLLAGSALAAVQAIPKGPLSLQQCIETAMNNQADVIVARNNVVAAKSRSAQAKASYWPQVSIQNNAFVFGSQNVLTQSTTGTAFNVSESIFDGGLREANVRQTRYGVVGSSASLSRTTQTVAFNVTSDFYDVLRAKRLADVAQANVKYSEELRDQVKFRAEQGDVAEVDVLPVESQLANARVNLVSAKNSVRTASLQLQSTMGIMPTADFEIQDVKTVAEPEISTLEAYVKNAREARPDVLGSKADIGAARAAVTAARINLYPRPVISGEYQRQISGGFTTSGSQVVGGIVFDLFNGGANRAAYKEAKALQASAAAEERQLYQDIQVQVESAYLNLTSAKERLEASEMGLASAQKNFDVQKERYSLGLAITLDLLNAEVQLITAQTSEVQARYDYYTAISQLEYAVGKQVSPNAS